MTLSYSECQALAKELEAFIGKKPIALWKSGQHCYYLQFSSASLFFSLRVPFVRFYRVEHLPKRKEKMLTPFKKEAPLKEVRLESNNKILSFLFSNGESIVFEVFSRRANLLFLSEENRILYSHRKLKEEKYLLPEGREEIRSEPALTDSVEVARRYGKLEREAEVAAEKKRIEKLLLKRRKNAEKKSLVFEEEKEKAQKWPKLQQEASLLQGNFHLLKRGMSKVAVMDWEENCETIIALDEKSSPQENVAALFKRVKKMRNSLPHIDQQRELLKKRKRKLEALLEELVTCDDLKELARFAKEHGLEQQEAPRQKEKKEARFYREYKSSSGLLILVGKSATDNDRLTFQVARGNDYWLHVAGYPGSHVILKVQRGETPPDEEALLDAAQVALHYSKAKQKGGAEVHVTQQKYLTRAGKKKPGKVLLSRQRTLYVELDPERFARIKKRVATPAL